MGRGASLLTSAVTEFGDGAGAEGGCKGFRASPPYNTSSPYELALVKEPLEVPEPSEIELVDEEPVSEELDVDEVAAEVELVLAPTPAPAAIGAETLLDCGIGRQTVTD